MAARRTHPGPVIEIESAQARAAMLVNPLPTGSAEEGVLVILYLFEANWAVVGLGRARVWALTRQQKKEKEGRGRVKEGKEERKRRLT